MLIFYCKIHTIKEPRFLKESHKFLSSLKAVLTKLDHNVFGTNILGKLSFLYDEVYVHSLSAFHLLFIYWRDFFCQTCDAFMLFNTDKIAICVVHLKACGSSVCSEMENNYAFVNMQCFAPLLRCYVKRHVILDD